MRKLIFFSQTVEMNFKKKMNALFNALLMTLKLRKPETPHQIPSWNDLASNSGDLLGIFWNSKLGDDWEFTYIEMGDEERLI
jgi:hypothetical protein